jgi:hypothetical protein
LCGFQNIWSLSVFVAMSIRPWLLFTLIACWLAISEETHLKSTTSFSLINKSLNQVQKVYELEGLCNIKYFFLKVIWSYVDYVNFFLISLSSSIFFLIPFLILCPIKTRVSSFRRRICPTSHRLLVRYFRLVRYPIKISIWIEIFSFDLSLLSILIYVIMWRFCRT